MKMTVVAGVLISVLVVVLTTRVSMCFPRNKTAEEIKNEDMENNENLIAYRNQFLCGAPQPRAIYLHEIVGDEVWKSEYMEKVESVVPYSVILHRCENSGCCKKYNERCKPANETEVKLTFMYTKKTNSSQNLSFEYRNYVAKNHTVCECGTISDKQIK